VKCLRVIAALVLLGTTPVEAGVRPSPSHAGPKLDSVTLAVYHRVFHEFRDRRRVRLNQEFQIGDTDYTATVVQYVPDFAMDLKSRKVISRTDQPNNPAFRIIVREKEVPQDTTWAMLHMPPHFAMKSFLAFQVLRIDFVGRAPILADTTAVPPPAKAPPSPSPSPHASPSARP
jgi:hypothetical protein